jgi:hypothetical protein
MLRCKLLHTGTQYISVSVVNEPQSMIQENAGLVNFGAEISHDVQRSFRTYPASLCTDGYILMCRVDAA